MYHGAEGLAARPPVEGLRGAVPIDHSVVGVPDDDRVLGQLEECVARARSVFQGAMRRCVLGQGSNPVK